MSNQFFKYLAYKLDNYFQNISYGDRYYIQLDSDEAVRELYFSLMNLPTSNKFIYNHNEESSYESFYLDGPQQLVVAATIDGVTPDYLVTLRNFVAEQKGVWSGKAILFLTSTTLDSIKGGCSDMQKKGMPLHFDELTKNLMQEITDSDLKDYEKIIIEHYLERKKNESLIRPDMWEYADVLTIIHDGQITKEKYRLIGVFIDESLPSYTRKAITERLEDNHKYFEIIQNAHQYGDIEVKLKKFFGEEGIRKFKRDDWGESTYVDVLKAKDELRVEKFQSLGYLEKNSKLTEDGLLFWDKPSLETTAGRRNRNIIVFNSKKLNQVNFVIEFDDFLKKEFLDKKSSLYSYTGGKKIFIKMNHTIGMSSFFKVIYKHNNKTSSRYVFNIVIVDFDQDQFDSIKTHFEINADKGQIRIESSAEEIVIGKNSEELDEVHINSLNECIKINQEKGIKVSSDSIGWEEDELGFNVLIGRCLVPFLWKADSRRIQPINATKIWNMKREAQEDFKYDYSTNKTRIGTREFSTHIDMRPYFIYEKKWVEGSFLYAKVEGNEIFKETIEIDEDLYLKYEAVLQWFKQRDNIPSFTYLDGEGKKIINEFLELYIIKINEIKEKNILTTKQKNLSKIGVAYNSSKIYLTPFHPILLAYQIQLNEEVKDEMLDLSIIGRLNPNNLLPFSYGNDGKIYKATSKLFLREWVTLEPVEKVSVGETNEFLAAIINEKLNQFLNHFEYLFVENSLAPLKLNIVDIYNDKEIVKGILSFLIKRIQSKGINSIIPMEISIYNKNNFRSEFEIFSTYESPEDVENVYDLELKIQEIDSIDVLRVIRDNIRYSKHINNTDFAYSHITFYKIETTKKFANINQKSMETGVSNKGLMSSLPSIFAENDYRSGYGVKNILNADETLYKVVQLTNELMANMKEEGNQVYQKDVSIASIMSNFDIVTMNKLYQASHWVTFIDPNVGFDFFTRSNSQIVIIHYSDQFTNSSKLDAITVTNKIKQYENVVMEYLRNNNVEANPAEVHEAIQSFNCLNGEWLLRMIGRRGEFTREKLSTLSAVKVMSGYLNHENIVWVPVSLEEILRVAGAVKLKKRDGMFSAENLSSSGSHSDDILMIGLEDRGSKVALHFYPIEVKIGINDATVIKKAKDQVIKTGNLIRSELSKSDDVVSQFKHLMYRNFFVQVLLSNIEKLKMSQIKSEKLIEQIDKWKGHLLDDEYILDYSLDRFIGKGAVISFKKDLSFRSSVLENDICMVNMTETDAYQDVIVDESRMIEDIQSGIYEFPINKLLFNVYNPDLKSDITEVDSVMEEFPVAEIINEVDTQKNTKNNDEVVPLVEDMKMNINAKAPTPLQDIRLLIGTAEGSNRKIFWEYGHKDLSNRHILISGKSGHGKSYLIQCLLKDLSQSGVSSVIFDYTDGFKKSKLEDGFKDAVGKHIEQFLVALNKFPINPFKRNKKELDEGIIINEDNTDIAERIKSVFGSVYHSLGIQQLNSIYEAVIRGLNNYDGFMHLGHLLSELEDDSSNYAKTAASTIKPLIDKNPFDHKSSFNWDNIFSSEGKVFIIQLTGYTRDVQLIITEFILWDLWNYKLQSGDPMQPFPVILDEAQNLDHSDKSPSAKILTEGRKFGWSGWYATQFMRGQMSSDEIMRLQNSGLKIYFAPPEGEVSTIAANISNDSVEKKEWEKKLKNLQKGQCIFVGSVKDENGLLIPGQSVIVNIDSMENR